MTTITNAKNLGQYKSRFSLIVEQILGFASSTNLVREVKNASPNFKTNFMTMFYVIDKSYSDK